jgi:hypothetical protein
MEKVISCFVPVTKSEDFTIAINQLKNTDIVKKIFLMSDVKHVDTPYTLIHTNPLPFELDVCTLERFVNIANDINAGLVYSDYNYCEKKKQKWLF